jgi:F-type H+-transporting ATPase subunit b
MSINATLVVEVIAFLLFIYSFKRWLWTPILNAMEVRETRIAEGLAAAERGNEDLDNARERAETMLREAREKATQIVDNANRRADEVADQAREQATAERDQQVRAAREDIAQETGRAREALRGEVSALAVQAAQRILQREIDPERHRALLDELAGQI